MSKPIYAWAIKKKSTRELFATHFDKNALRDSHSLIMATKRFEIVKVKIVDASLLSYEKVKIEENRKIMLGCELIATTDTCKVFQSENRNVITIEHDGYYYHVTLGDILKSILMGKE